ncbi:hypothetical protein GJA_4485 [Janthinobacterium agaricidamnosum NBRC 102515 = DSM 9628]|uniref:Uncharacterized protein n=1 Tax=Janthinobacterium agaricidamnosum NBRC 102515 = DSM 9628 TaxID=1349767 RepID=W0VCR1_9BURK|nr:hypothetical protein GJA_4485 [Janthinobacterium agaricidamnosum NBRC 102515 = DSM 9628]
MDYFGAVSATLKQGKIPTKTHFSTQLPTLEEAKIVVKRFPIGKKGILLMKLRT